MFPLDFASQTFGLGAIALRMICALVIGAVIGTERQNAHRPAGMRTHMLVALGSCSVMITSQLLFNEYSAIGANTDPARLSAQVIAGVGFLGAGTIIREGATVKGLTTAASIWTVACLGIAVGAGYFFVGLIGTGCMLVTLILFEWVQKRYMWTRYGNYTYEVRCRDVAACLNTINALAARYKVNVASIQVTAEDEEQYLIEFHAEYSGRKADKRSREFFSEISENKNVLSAKSDRANT